MRRRHLAPAATGSAITLAMLGLLLILMPVSYKAGTSTSHAHSVFQALIDQAGDETHSHGDDSGTREPASSPLYLELNIPLSTIAELESPIVSIEALVLTHRLTHNAELELPQSSPDLPEITSLQATPDIGTALVFLSALLALLFIQQPMRRIWFSTSLPEAFRLISEGPPPRHLAA